MPKNPPDGMPRITPNMAYEDLGKALDWLSQAFGFELKMSMPGPDGAIMHAEMHVEDSVVMFSPLSSGDAWRSPRAAGGVTQSLYIYVDDLDAHCERARGAGATIAAEPEDMFWGDRTYVAQDLEGHRWAFAQHVRDVSPEDMQPPA
jgi:uncharacterized glyoxalase superfamily protein PhnB